MAKILYAEDMREIRVRVAYMLTRLGHEVVEAEDGAKALKEFEKGGFDLVLSDNEMPLLSGEDLCRKIRSLKSEIPFLLLSGHVQIGRIAKECGANGYMSKPVFGPTLKEEVERALTPKP